MLYVLTQCYATHAQYGPACHVEVSHHLGEETRRVEEVDQLLDGVFAQLPDVLGHTAVKEAVTVMTKTQNTSVILQK